MLLVVGLALAHDKDLSQAILAAEDPRSMRRTALTVGAGFTLLSASVVPMVVAWPEMPDPNDYAVDRASWNDDPAAYEQRLERRSQQLHAERQAYVRATWSRTTLSATLAAAGVVTLAVAPAWTLDLQDRAIDEATVGAGGVEVRF